ncbi:MAG: hypothetical protein ACTMUB_09360 [cyanobacterium endosymbiont of Rhopalodia musculus]|uniref:hypothetical protein n=1 Tax=cyanobacterium endosymbiont of Epithemia clementina EcSB TaxID=3034674 RepID=UPI0024802262|nr:hypothetical protein [cyanobacterium endosymbiont of Epithemia clementina EcSB]WGT68259.1 hypothetical protein P3F56_04145 [cyanobacterium endosymbiont of Epithemia clementina EcSB]
MIMLLARLQSLTTIALIPVSLLIPKMSSLPVVAGNADWNQFDVCITEIAQYGVEQDKAALACSDALIPKELSQCVTMINGATPIEGDDALSACYQVRRPIDLGHCVADIYNAIPNLSLTSTETSTENLPTTLTEPFLLTLLTACRASLRPGHYSECVIAVNRNLPDVTPIKALNMCLAAEDFPSALFPVHEP